MHVLQRIHPEEERKKRALNLLPLATFSGILISAGFT